MSGRLEVITGTMFSGKTVELMRLLERVAIARECTSFSSRGLIREADKIRSNQTMAIQWPLLSADRRAIQAHRSTS